MSKFQPQSCYGWAVFDWFLFLTYLCSLADGVEKRNSHFLQNISSNCWCMNLAVRGYSLCGVVWCGVDQEIKSYRAFSIPCKFKDFVNRTTEDGKHDHKISEIYKRKKQQQKTNKKRWEEQKVQTIYIGSTYRIYLQLSPLHNQSEQKFGLLHATLRQNDWRSSSFFVSLWFRVKAQVIHSSIKLKSLVTFIIIPSLKEIAP